MPSRVKKPRSEQRRSSAVGGSPASGKGAKITTSIPIPATSPSLQPPVSQPSSITETQVPVQAQVPLTVLKTSPVKLSSPTIVTVRQEMR